jgi:hypothetical protein
MRPFRREPLSSSRSNREPLEDEGIKTFRRGRAGHNLLFIRISKCFAIGHDVASWML